MTPLVAILTLSTAAAAAAPPPISAAGITALEHVPLPSSGEPRVVRVRALESQIVVEAPREAAGLAAAIRRAPRSICPDLEVLPGAVRLRCRSRRIVAHLTQGQRGAILEIRETKGLPWVGEDGPVLVPFGGGEELDAESACPDRPATARGECLLARNDRAAARDAFAEAAAGGDGQAALRLGDLAYAVGDLHAAAEAWGRVRGDPWQRVATARTCELSWKCLAAGGLAALYEAPPRTPAAVARDLTLRLARALAFTGRAGEASAVLLGSATGRAACAAALPTCRRAVLEALRGEPPVSTDALALLLELPRRDRAALSAYPIEQEAARLVAEMGAPLFAATLLASAVGLAPATGLDAHLLRTAELYLEGGDRVRAGVVLEFARARAGGRAPAGRRWAAVARAVRGRGQPEPARASPARADDLEQLLAGAAQATELARALPAGGGRP